MRYFIITTIAGLPDAAEIYATYEVAISRLLSLYNESKILDREPLKIDDFMEETSYHITLDYEVIVSLVPMEKINALV